MIECWKNDIRMHSTPMLKVKINWLWFCNFRSFLRFLDERKQPSSAKYGSQVCDRLTLLVYGLLTIDDL